MHRDLSAAKLLQRYAAGERRFVGVWLEERSDLRGAVLEEIVFEESGFSDIDVRGANLRGATFRSCNMKCTDFRSADLTDARFEDVLIESAAFVGAIVDGCTFKRLHAYSATFDGLSPDERDR